MPKSTVTALTFYYLLLGTVWERTLAADRVKREQYHIQNGACSYTFLLPQEDNCQSRGSDRNLAQRDDPAEYDESFQRLEQLEHIMENNTQWLLKVGRPPPPSPLPPPHLISLQICYVMATLARSGLLFIYLCVLLLTLLSCMLMRVTRLVWGSNWFISNLGNLFVR